METLSAFRSEIRQVSFPSDEEVRSATATRAYRLPIGAVAPFCGAATIPNSLLVDGRLYASRTHSTQSQRAKLRQVSGCKHQRRYLNAMRANYSDSLPSVALMNGWLGYVSSDTTLKFCFVARRIAAICTFIEDRHRADSGPTSSVFITDALLSAQMQFFKVIETHSSRNC